MYLITGSATHAIAAECRHHDGQEHVHQVQKDLRVHQACANLQNNIKRLKIKQNKNSAYGM